jgi:hypothetical protein
MGSIFQVFTAINANQGALLVRVIILAHHVQKNIVFLPESVKLFAQVDVRHVQIIPFANLAMMATIFQMAFA